MSFKKKSTILFYLLFSTLSCFAQNQYFFKAVNACKKVGESVILKDTVASVEPERSGQVYLNFGKPFPRQDFTVVIFAETLEKFKKVEPLTLQGQEVKVKGIISKYRGNCQLIINKEDQFIMEE